MSDSPTMSGHPTGPAAKPAPAPSATPRKSAPGPAASGFSSRRDMVLGLGAAFAAGAFVSAAGFRISGAGSGARRAFVDVAEDVTPSGGIDTPLVLGDKIARLVDAGAIVPQKFRQVYQNRGGVPDWAEAAMAGPVAEPVRIDFKTAPVLLNLLWPLGLANRTEINRDSPVNDYDIRGFASTGGWTLGEAQNGADYFNRLDLIALDGGKEATVRGVAEATFRPCCDNSAFFQDCNHGSAMLALIELGVEQGLAPEQISRIGLYANSFWFPRVYLKSALYFSVFESRDWPDIDPSEILQARYSSATGWNGNVNAAMMLTNYIPRGRLIQMGSAACGV